MRRLGRWWRTGRWVLLGLCVVLVVGRLLMPYGVEKYVNHQLNKSHDYEGHIGKVVIQLWRGRYVINDIAISKRGGVIPVPLFSASQLSLAIQWKELFHGAVVGEILMAEPRLNFEQGPTAAQSQTGTGEKWDSVLESLFPFKLNRLEIKDGQIHFQNRFSKPPVDIFLSQCTAVVTNLTNSKKVKSELAAGVTASGTSIGGGGLHVNVQINPFAATPTYQAMIQLTNVDLPALNNFLEAYGKFQVARGTFAVFVSIASKNGDYDGDAKVFFRQMHVLSWSELKHENPLSAIWQTIVAGLASIFKNQPHDFLAARIPITGSYGKSKVGIWSAVGSVLHNAFIKALTPEFGKKVTVQMLEQKEEQNQEK